MLEIIFGDLLKMKKMALLQTARFKVSVWNSKYSIGQLVLPHRNYMRATGEGSTQLSLLHRSLTY